MKHGLHFFEKRFMLALHLVNFRGMMMKVPQELGLKVRAKKSCLEDNILVLFCGAGLISVGESVNSLWMVCFVGVGWKMIDGVGRLKCGSSSRGIHSIQQTLQTLDRSIHGC